MRQKLFYLGCAFVFMWTLGQVFEAPHRQNLVQALSMTFAYGVYLGLHSMMWQQIKAFVIKN